MKSPNILSMPGKPISPPRKYLIFGEGTPKTKLGREYAQKVQVGDKDSAAGILKSAQTREITKAQKLFERVNRNSGKFRSNWRKLFSRKINKEELSLLRKVFQDRLSQEIFESRADDAYLLFHIAKPHGKTIFGVEALDATHRDELISMHVQKGTMLFEAVRRMKLAENQFLENGTISDELLADINHLNEQAFNFERIILNLRLKYGIEYEQIQKRR